MSWYVYGAPSHDPRLRNDGLAEAFTSVMVISAGAFMARTMVLAFYGWDVPSSHPDGVLTHLTEIPPHVFESPAFAE